MRRSLLSLVALSSLLACGEPPVDKPVDTGVETPRDADGDGLTADFDCDDANADVHVYAVEVCDGVDNDCDGLMDDADDDAALDAWYADADQDGVGDADTLTRACEAPAGAVAEAGDCDDANADQYPGAAEVCDGLDNDCDGVFDDDAEDAATWYLDADGDGHGTDRYARVACEAAPGWVAAADDCDDLRAEAAPGMPELCNALDDNCDGLADEEAIDAATWYADLDGDGFGDPDASAVSCTAPSAHVAVAGDCDDGSAAVSPDQDEACNGIDDDCDGVTDDPAAGDTATWYVDADGDGYGGESAVTACAPPAGTVAVSGDCDDAATHRYPGAVEVCDDADDDCDGLVDDGASDAPTWYIDYDADGFGAAAYTLASCDAPTGYVAAASDCNDAASGARPDGVEVCDGLDNDCDGTTDGADATDAARWYADADGDGHGDPARVTIACAAPAGHVAVGDDCNDASAYAFPGALEICDGLDNDCDATTDEASALDASTWYLDADADGYGEVTATVDACDAPIGYVANATDCDDAAASARPGGTETCNGADDDCDGSTDEAGAVDAATWYRDADTDGYGSVLTSTTACAAPTGYVADATDCNDGLATARPGGVETCNGVDDDCDGSTDEAGAVDAATWYRDADADGFGTATTTANACTAPSGYVALATDCDDGSSAVRPDASETCNGVDDDCDGSTDESSAADAAVWYRDADADGYGTSSTTVTACTAPSGYRPAAGDCNDASAAVRPGASEDCDGLDNDCDGSTDEDGRYGDIARCAADSCVDVLRTRTDSPSNGVYWIDPASTGAYQAYCDMSRRGGGWTLLAVFSNADGSARWSPDSANWVDTGTFGAPTSASTTSDAKSQAWSDLAVDEVMIADASSSVYVQSSTSCVGSNTMRWLFRRNSSSSANCAWSCSTTTVSSPWNQSQTDATLRFRCMDTNGGTTTANGFVMSGDDNSMITTMQNGSYIDYNFGLGAGYVGSFADYDSSTDDYGNPSVTTPILLLGR